MCRRAHRHVQLVLDRAADLLLQRRGTHQGKQPLHDARAWSVAAAERDDHVITRHRGARGASLAPWTMTAGALRVAFVHPDLGIGGAERLVVDAALSLQERGHDVCVITSHYDPSHAFEPTRNGALRVVHAQTRMPRSILHKFHLPMAILQQLSLVMQVVVATHGAGLARTYPALYRALTHIDPQACPDVFVLDQLPVAIPLLKLLCGRRVVYYCHFPDKEISAALARQRGDHGLRAMVRRLYRLPLDVLEEATTKAADRILVNSHFTAAHFRRVFPHIVCRPRVVYPAVDELEYTPQQVQQALVEYERSCHDADALRRCSLVQQLVQVGDRPILLSINRFEAKKNIVLALHTVAHLRHTRRDRVRLVCAGGYDARVQDNIATLAALQAQATRLGLSHTTLWGRRPSSASPLHEPTTPEHVLGADVVLLPSLPGALLHALLHAPALRALLYTPTDEHFGIVPLEAMVCGVPVLATDTGGPLETVVDAALDADGQPQARDATGFLCAPNAEQWASVCHRVLDWDEDTRTRIASAARQRVQTHFSVRTMGAALDEHVRAVGAQAVPWSERAQIFGVVLALLLMHAVAVYVVLG